MAHRDVAKRERGDVFGLSTTRNRATLTVRVSGSLGARTGRHLEDVLCQLARSGDSVVLDLRSVRAVEAGGLDAVVRSHLQLSEVGADLKVRAAAGLVELSLSEGGLVLEVAPS